MMPGGALRVALVHEVFHGDGAADRLASRLDAARRAGARLALLPELPLDRWIPATRERRDDDAEEPGGRRHRLLGAAAAGAGIGLLGGAIVREPATGRRHNRALLFGATGELVGSYDKLHLPGEDGFWESDHYEPGDEMPQPVGGFALPLGLQICSDLQRPQGTHLLAARGAAAVLAPRATPPESYDRWRTVIRGNAVTACVYVLSVNRPRSEGTVAIGGPSIAVGPSGEVLAESTDALTLVDLEPEALRRARNDYPGYLAVRAGLYGRAWCEVAAGSEE